MKKISLLIVLLLTLTGTIAQLDTCMTGNTGNWYTNNGYQAGLADNLGVHMAGQDGGVFAWRSIQPNLLATFDWTNADSCVKALHANNIDLFATIRCVNPVSLATDSCTTNYTSQAGYSWLPTDTTKWLIFLDSLIERYDFNGFNDMPGLTRPVNHWRIETEWNIFWCSELTGLAAAQEFSGYVNLTYNEIKSKQPSSIISYAGMDTRHDLTVFYDGYTGESSICKSNDCSSTLPITYSDLNSNSTFMANDSGMRYILNNTMCDELDIHQYGRWQYIPDVVRWIRDSTSVTVPINFMEGGGPFCTFCEFKTSLPQLYRWNSNYVVYYYVTGISSKVSRLSWHISPEYNSWGPQFGDMDLQDSIITTGGYLKRPSYYAYQFLSDSIFSHPNADSIVKITEANPDLFHYRILPLNLDVIWSLNPTDSYDVSGTGDLYRWIIPTTCSGYPVYCDSSVQHIADPLNGIFSIPLTNGIPVFFSIGNVLSTSNEFEENQNLVSIYPNPSSNQITISTEYSDSFTYSFTEISGREIISGGFVGSSETIDISNLLSGIYIIKVVDSKGRINYDRFIKL